MQQKEQPRAASFLLVMSWVYLIFGLGMIGVAIYQLTNAETQLTFRLATDSVFLVVEGMLGIFAGIFGLVSKNLKRCRLIGLILFAIAAVPLIINLLAGDTFALYWKNLIAVILPFLYLLAALLKRSVKKPAVTELAGQQTAPADLSKYTASEKKPVSAPQAQAVPAPETQTPKPAEAEATGDQRL
ncbi:MAG: hypothetical protein VB062_06965 [Christensenella sp.]|nr:hypothetical protein [Christensenella sp.]